MIPAVTAIDRTSGIVDVRTIFAVPEIVFAGSVKGMLLIACRAIPTVIAMQTVGDGNVFYTRRAIPIMIAGFGWRETRSAAFLITETVTAVRTLRQRSRVFVCASGAIPLMRTMRIGVINLHADFTEPVPVAGRIGRMPIVV